MKLIDADALIEWLRGNTSGEDETVRQWFGSFERVLKRFPAFGDAVAVVRCKDCMWYGDECVGFSANGYCSEADRKREGKGRC